MRPHLNYHIEPSVLRFSGRTFGSSTPLNRLSPCPASGILGTRLGRYNVRIIPFFTDYGVALTQVIYLP